MGTFKRRLQYTRPRRLAVVSSNPSGLSRTTRASALAIARIRVPTKAPGASEKGSPTDSSNKAKVSNVVTPKDAGQSVGRRGKGPREMVLKKKTASLKARLTGAGGRLQSDAAEPRAAVGPQVMGRDAAS